MAIASGENENRKRSSSAGANLSAGLNNAASTRLRPTNNNIASQ